MKDITLKIIGKQKYEDKEEDQMEFISEGKMYQRNDATYIIYDESQLSGLEGCKTSLKILGQSLKMKRIGPVGYNTELYFEKGKRFVNQYETPYGPMDIEILTKVVEVEVDYEEKRGSINIEYDVSLEGRAEGKNRLTIDIM